MLLGKERLGPAGDQGQEEREHTLVTFLVWLLCELF